MTTTIWVPWTESAVYLDTSALIKRYVDEQATDLVDEILQPDGPRVFLSWVTVIETVSNLRRKERVERTLTADETNDRIRLLLTEMASSHVLTCQVGPRTTERARELLRETYLTPGDAVHLATALRLQEQHGWLPLVFVTADAKLSKVAESQFLYAYDVLNPVQPQIRGVKKKYVHGQESVAYSDA